MTSTPDRRLYTLQLSRRDLGWILNAMEDYTANLPHETDPHKEALKLLSWLNMVWGVWTGAPKEPAYFWLGEGAERISL